MSDWPVVIHEGEEIPWLELELKTGLANTTEQIDGNIERTLQSSYLPFNPLINSCTGAVSIVGSGPSLKETWQDIPKVNGKIIACNASASFLWERGLTPDYAMCFDADKLAEPFFKNPHKDVTYLIASRCHPIVYENLKDRKVIVWHAKGDLNIEKLLAKHRKMEPMVGGGGAAVTRTMFISQVMGFKRLHLWGADSSYRKGVGDTHIGKSTTEERYLQVMCNNKVFDTTPWMASQAEDFKALVPALQRIGLKISVHGDGLIPTLAKAMNLDVDGEKRSKQTWREVKWKAKTLWQNL